jgi:hypothetical protein
VLVRTAVVGMVVVSRSTAVEVTVTSVLWISVVGIVTKVQLVDVT